LLGGEVAERRGDLLGVPGIEPEGPQDQERLGLRGGDLRSDRAEGDLSDRGVVELQGAAGAPVVLLGSAAYLARPGGQGQAVVGAVTPGCS
jgi:hypothetical protein